MHNEKQIAGLHRKWNAKGSPRVAKCLEVYQAMQVYTFNRKSTLSIMCLSCQGVDYRLRLVFSCGLTSVPFPSFGYPFPVRSCPDMSCPELFYWQALLRRLHRNVPMSVPASVGIPVSVCSMPTILSESIHLLGVHANSHWATLYTTRHRAIHRHTEIKVSRKYAIIRK